MALTMTRTRTQTTLTRLAQLIANVHGELEVLDRLLSEYPMHRDALTARKQKVEIDRNALYLTLNQFDAALDPTCIGTSDSWLKTFGRSGSKAALKRYVASVSKVSAI